MRDRRVLVWDLERAHHFNVRHKAEQIEQKCNANIASQTLIDFLRIMSIE